MGVKLMTGATGEQNIQAVDDRECLAGVTGLDSYVFPTAGKLAATLTDSNTLTIGTGAGSLQGARFRCPTTTAVTIKSGTQAQYRRDIVGLRFSRASTGKESLSFEVLTGTPASTEAGAEDPAYDEGDLLAGDAEAFMPLYRVKLSGINVGEPEAMFSVLTPLADLRDSVSQLKAAQTPGAWTYLYGSDGGEYVAARLVGPIAELRWSFTQGTTNTWVLDGLPAGMRPAAGFVVPAVSAYKDGSISNNTAMCEVWSNGTIHFRNMSGITDGLNRGHCLWVVG